LTNPKSLTFKGAVLRLHLERVKLSGCHKSPIRVSVVFTCNEPNRAGWPYINYDCDRRAERLMEILCMGLQDFDFTHYVLRHKEEVDGIDWERFDGIVVYMISGNWRGIAERIIEMRRPTILIDDLFGGSGGFLRAHSIARRKNLPVVGVSSSNMNDAIDAIRLLRVIKMLRNSRILDVTDRDISDISSEIRDTFGIKVIKITSDELNAYYEKTNEAEAEKIADKWVRDALKVVEPSREEIVRSARMYLALKKAMQDNDADAVTIDCLSLCYEAKIPAYPCLALFQLNNEGSTGVCEADLNSTITQLMMRYLTGRPGYVSDPVIDTASNQIIYAHCVASNRVYGPNGLSNPYIIRSHSEDRKGASVQSLMPLGETVTTLRISVEAKAMCIHQGITVANIEDDRACRTKLAAKTDAERILENWNVEVDFGWHRVTFYGDWRRQAINLARLLGLKVIEEDK